MAILEEVKDYLRNNLKIKIEEDILYGDNILSVKILLEDEEISSEYIITGRNDHPDY